MPVGIAKIAIAGIVGRGRIVRERLAEAVHADLADLIVGHARQLRELRGIERRPRLRRDRRVRAIPLGEPRRRRTDRRPRVRLAGSSQIGVPWRPSGNTDARSLSDTDTAFAPRFAAPIESPSAGTSSHSALTEPSAASSALRIRPRSRCHHSFARMPDCDVGSPVPSNVWPGAVSVAAVG